MFRIIKQDPYSRARLGLLETNHGVVETPAYTIVGTHAEVRAMSVGDLMKAKTQLLIVNTYHMWRKLGDDGVRNFSGLHKAMGWEKTIMTDSGGFQVFSMGAAREHRVSKTGINRNNNSAPSADKSLVTITEEGAFIRDCGEVYLDAEKSIAIQERLGADIIYAFDECTSPYHDYEYTKASLVRTHRWAERSLKAKTSDQLLYGIVQGGSFEDLRKESAHVIGSLPFDGFGIGGAFSDSFGSTMTETIRELDWVMPLLPENKPRHLLGIGRIRDLFYGVQAGIDTFDCVVPTREARHALLWTNQGKVDIRKGIYAGDQTVLDIECGCPVCKAERVTKDALHHLFKSKDPEAGHLASIHNVYFFNDLMRQIREAITKERFPAFKETYLRAYPL